MVQRHGRDRARPCRWHRPFPRSLWLIGLLVLISAIEARGDSRSPVLGIHPSTIVLTGADVRQQVAVTQSLGDDSLRDLTRDCRYIIEPPSIATITDQGLVRPLVDGNATLRDRS